MLINNYHFYSISLSYSKAIVMIDEMVKDPLC